MTNKQLMKCARLNLHGRWLHEIGPLALLGIVVFIIAMIFAIPLVFYGESSILATLSLWIFTFFLTPIYLGCMYYYYNISENKYPSFKNFFHGYKILRKIIPALIFFILVGVFWEWYVALIDKIVLLKNDISLLIALLLWGVIWIILFVRLTPLIMLSQWHIALGYETRALNSISFVASKMKGHYKQYFFLHFRFLGWFILSCLTLGIGFLWLIPYWCVTMAHFYKEFIEETTESEWAEIVE